LAQDDDGEWAVDDLNSTNGTFVNEARIRNSKLADGDQVRFGDAIYKFLAGSNIESAYHEAIHNMAIQDGMTGIANKRHFGEFLEREVAVAHRHGHPLTLVMFDVDHFKKVNDTQGHLAGDAVLKDLTARIKPRVRREDLFARYGGEEFACVLPSTALAGGVVFAEQLRVMVEERPTVFGDKSISFTISLGVATLQREAGVDAQTLIKRADENLYAAKRGGRNRVVPTLGDLIPG
jgi:diguanylate cyclase (GGDEF)-like protein